MDRLWQISLCTECDANASGVRTTVQTAPNRHLCTSHTPWKEYVISSITIIQPIVWNVNTLSAEFLELPSLYLLDMTSTCHTQTPAGSTRRAEPVSETGREWDPSQMVKTRCRTKSDRRGERNVECCCSVQLLFRHWAAEMRETTKLHDWAGLLAQIGRRYISDYMPILNHWYVQI
jgi:hypothetical protein